MIRSRELKGKDTIVFYNTVEPGQTLTMYEKIYAPCTIEGVRVKFAKGQQQYLKVYPMVKVRKNTRENIIKYATGSLEYLAGDDDNFSFEVSFSIAKDDVLEIKAVNTAETYAYTCSVFVDVDYNNDEYRG